MSCKLKAHKNRHRSDSIDLLSAQSNIFSLQPHNAKEVICWHRALIAGTSAKIRSTESSLLKAALEGFLSSGMT